MGLNGSLFINETFDPLTSKCAKPTLCINSKFFNKEIHVSTNQQKGIFYKPLPKLIAKSKLPLNKFYSK